MYKSSCNIFIQLFARLRSTKRAIEAMDCYFLSISFANNSCSLETVARCVEEDVECSDIIEMAMVAAVTDHEFHRFIKISYPVHANVQQVTGITTNMLNAEGCSFKDAMQAFLDFIYNETNELNPSTGIPTIIAHGGYEHVFPVLLANCMKHKFQDSKYNRNVLQHCTFVDSRKLLNSMGYRSADNFSKLCSDMDLTRSDYKVALDDARLLKTIFQKLLHNASWDPLYYSYSFADIENYFFLKDSAKEIMKRNYIILDMEMIQTTKDHACIRKFYALSKDSKTDIEMDGIPCKQFKDLEKKYQKAFFYCRNHIHHLGYYPTRDKERIRCQNVKFIIKNFLLRVNADIIFYKGGIHEKDISAEIGVDSFNIEELGIPKTNSHDPKEEVHTHYKKLKMWL